MSTPKRCDRLGRIIALLRPIELKIGDMVVQHGSNVTP
jgi:hypothetical protein